MLRWPPLWWSAPLKRRTVASLFRQNSLLRDNIEREFTFSAAATAYPGFCAEMEAYQQTLLQSALQNDKALRALFGEHEPGLLDRARELIGEDHSYYDGLGSLWRHLAKDWTAEGVTAAGELRSRIVDLVADAAPSSVLVPGCGQVGLARERGVSSRLCDSRPLLIQGILDSI